MKEFDIPEKFKKEGLFFLGPVCIKNRNIIKCGKMNKNRMEEIFIEIIENQYKIINKEEIQEYLKKKYKKENVIH